MAATGTGRARCCAGVASTMWIRSWSNTGTTKRRRSSARCGPGWNAWRRSCAGDAGSPARRSWPSKVVQIGRAEHRAWLDATPAHGQTMDRSTVDDAADAEPDQYHPDTETTAADVLREVLD